MSYAWVVYWDRLTKEQQAKVLRAVEIREHPTDPEGVGFELAIKREASQRAVNAAMRIMRRLEGPQSPPIGAVRVYLLRRAGLSYEAIADDRRVKRYLTRTTRSTMESRRKIAFEAVRSVKKYQRTAPRWQFNWIAAIAAKGPSGAIPSHQDR